MKTIERIYKRTLIFGQIAQWGLTLTLGLELRGATGGWARLMTRYGLLEELTEHEHTLTEEILTGRAARWANHASWYCEGLAPCMWLLGLAEPPPVDSDVGLAALTRRLFHELPALEQLTLRGPAERARELRRWFWVHRRVHAFVRGIPGGELEAWMRRAGEDPERLGVPLLAGDLAFDGRPLRELEPDALPYGRDFVDATAWRLRALRWACGDEDSFDRVRACPHGLETRGECSVEHVYADSSELTGSTALDARGGRDPHRAVFHDLVERLAAGRELESVDLDGRTPLDVAVEIGSAARLRQLIARGAPLTRGPGGHAPLGQAARRGDVDVVRALLDAGVEPDAPGADGVAPIFHAVTRPQPRILEALLAAGASTEARSHARQTPLLYALQSNNLDAAARLLEAGADPHAVDDRGQSALHWAASRGALALVRQLIARGASLEARAATGHTPLAAAADAGQLECARALLEAGADVHARTLEEDTVLHIAAYKGLAPLVDTLLARGVDVNARRRGGHTALMGALLSDQPAIVHAMLAGGADPNVGDHHGVTPLHFAANRGLDPVVGPLLAAGADPNAMTKSGHTPLMLVANGSGGDMVAPLLAAGADPEARHASSGQTALHMAARRNAAAVAALLAAGADRAALDRRGQTPLAYARERGNAAAARMLEDTDP